MWKQKGRSSALDRAEALLSAKRSSGGGERSSRRLPAPKTQGSLEGSSRTRLVPPETHTLSFDLSDLSLDSSVSAQEAEDDRSANAKGQHAAQRNSSKDVRPLSPLGGGNRFLKKAPAPTSSSPSQQVQEPRYVSSSRHGSQTATLTRLSEIESFVRIRKQTLEQARQATTTSTLRTSPPPVVQSEEASEQLSAHSDQSQRRKRFLKKKPAEAAERSDAASVVALRGSDVDVEPRINKSDAVVPSAALDMKPGRVTSAVSLDSDRDDMKRLLGDSMDSTDYSLPGAGRTSSMKTSNKILHRPSQRVQSTAPPAASSPSNAAPPSCGSSPFRFTGQARAHFSPSVLSPSPSPPHVSSLERMDSLHEADSPHSSLSSSLGQADVLSLEELLPVGPASEDPLVQMSSVSSEDSKIHVMMLEELIPASAGITSETPGDDIQSKHTNPIPGFSSSLQQLPQEEEEEVVVEYESDFESDDSVSEDMQGGRKEGEVLSQARKEASDSDGCHERTEEDSSAFSDPSPFRDSQVSNWNQRSKSFRSTQSSSPASSGSPSSSQLSRRHTSTREAAVQTQSDLLADSWSAGVATLDPTLGRFYMKPSPVVTHAVSAEGLEVDVYINIYSLRGGFEEALLALMGHHCSKHVDLNPLSNSGRVLRICLLSGGDGDWVKSRSAVTHQNQAAWGGPFHVLSCQTVHQNLFEAHQNLFDPAAFALNEVLKHQLTMTRRFIDRSDHLHSCLLRSLDRPDYRYTTLQDTIQNIHKRRPPKLSIERALKEVQQEMTEN